MSFSSEIKEEMSVYVPEAKHCCIAELSALFAFCGRIVYTENGRFFTKIHTENLAVARKYFTLLRKSFNIEGDITVKRNLHLKNSRIYTVIVADESDSRKLLQALRYMNAEGEILEDGTEPTMMLLQNICCRRAYLRGAFLAAGSMSDPQKAYHFEISCQDLQRAEFVQQLMRYFEVDAKVILRKNHYITYVKDGTQIVDMLNIMEAPTALMALENIRIAKEIRNSVNRQVNCEMANINKTVSAAAKQVEDILLIKNTIGFAQLSDGLREIADLRIENPEVSLQELGKMLSTPVGKSGVNHRLRKLSQIANELREKFENIC